jgi:hypothetical protein
VGHVAAPEPTSARRHGPKLQFTWQRVDARPALCLDLELVCGGTRSSGCQQSRYPFIGWGWRGGEGSSGDRNDGEWRLMIL